MCFVHPIQVLNPGLLTQNLVYQTIASFNDIKCFYILTLSTLHFGFAYFFYVQQFRNVENVFQSKSCIGRLVFSAISEEKHQHNLNKGIYRYNDIKHEYNVHIVIYSKIIVLKQWRLSRDHDRFKTDVNHVLKLQLNVLQVKWDFRSKCFHLK